MKKIFTQLYTTSSGFTLLETLFAVIIFSFALVSLMTIAGKGVIATTMARDQLTAEFLAEEGLEVVRNIRDSNYVDGAAWDTGLSQCFTGNKCDVEYAPSGSKPTMIVCDTDCSGRILYNNQGQFRSDSGPDETTFWREVTIQTIPGPGGGDNQAVVKSTVNWKQKNILRSLTVTTYLADWQ